MIDTNVVIYELQGTSPYIDLVRHVFQLMRLGALIGTISTVVEAEVLVKPLRDHDSRAIEQAVLFFRRSPNLAIRAVDRAVAASAAAVRAETRLPLPDSIIVATALEERCDAVIGNDKAMAGSAPAGIKYLYLEDFISR